MILFGYTRINHNSGLLLSLDTIGYFWDVYPNLNVFFVSPRCMSLNKRDETKETTTSWWWYPICRVLGCLWLLGHWREGGEFSQSFYLMSFSLLLFHSPRLIPKTSMYWQTSSHLGTVFSHNVSKSPIVLSQITTFHWPFLLLCSTNPTGRNQKTSPVPHPKDLDHHCHETFVMARIGWKGHDSPAKVATQLTMQAVM